MKILITTRVMNYLSGAPMYNYELARELQRIGDEVVVMSEWGNPTEEGKKLKDNLEAEGVECVEWTEEKKWKFDLWIASELTSMKAEAAANGAPMINVVHSEYEVESPIPEIPFAYVCIRPEIKEHLVKEHGIAEEKCHVIYNGIDRKRFKKVKKNRRFYKLTVIPCTLDPLREKFIRHMALQADRYNYVHFYGRNYGVNVEETEYVKVFPETFDIQEPIANADEVAGILLGRVNLEANSCRVPSWIYDPVTLQKKEFFLKDEEFDKRHNIKHVAKKIKDLARMDDITIIIPHYSQQEMLANILKDLMVMKNIIVMKTGSFAENCNRGAKMAETKYIVFLNDDTRIEDPRGLFTAMRDATKKAEIIGCRATYGVNGVNLKNKTMIPVMDTTTPVRWPAGHCIMMTRDTFKKLGGYDELFVNGCEDSDMFLRAEEMKMKIKTIDMAIEHIGSQSEGRFAHINRNVLKFNTRWKKKAKVPHKHARAPKAAEKKEEPVIIDEWETV